MIKVLKKTAILVLTLVMLLVLFPTTVFAKDSKYCERLTAPTSNNAYYHSLNIYNQTGYGMPNCTAYAYGRAYELTNKKPLISRGNAGEWWSINKNNNYYTYGSKPKLGAIACWDHYDNYSGHVAVVEKINNNSVTISESQWGGQYFLTETISANGTDYAKGYRFLGYIYIMDGTVAEIEAAKKAAKIEASKSYKMEETLPTTETQTKFDKIKLGSVTAEPVNTTRSLIVIASSEPANLTI